MQFIYGEFKNKQKKDQTKFFDLLERGFEPQISVIFPPTIWIFTEGEGDKIKSKQPSKRDRTLRNIRFWLKVVSTILSSISKTICRRCQRKFIGRIFLQKRGNAWRQKRKNMVVSHTLNIEMIFFLKYFQKRWVAGNSKENTSLYRYLRERNPLTLLSRR